MSIFARTKLIISLTILKINIISYFRKTDIFDAHYQYKQQRAGR